MKLIDVVNGPVWVLWCVFALIAVMSALMLSGHGDKLIAGYNTASQEEREKYDRRKLGRVIGLGLAAIAVLVLVMAIWVEVLPASFIYIFLAVVIVDSIVMIALANTICRR